MYIIVVLIPSTQSHPTFVKNYATQTATSYIKGFLCDFIETLIFLIFCALKGKHNQCAYRMTAICAYRRRNIFDDGINILSKNFTLVSG